MREGMGCEEAAHPCTLLPVGGCFYTPEKNLPFSFYIAQLAQLGPWRVLCGYKKRCVAVLGLAAGL